MSMSPSSSTASTFMRRIGVADTPGRLLSWRLLAGVFGGFSLVCLTGFDLRSTSIRTSGR
jgi:hypothetical protein